MKKLQSKLAANVRKVKEQSVATPTTPDQPKTVAAAPATAATVVAPPPLAPPSPVHPTRIWPD